MKHEEIHKRTWDAYLQYATSVKSAQMSCYLCGAGDGRFEAPGYVSVVLLVETSFGWICSDCERSEEADERAAE
jgi:hypothetical protein